jgi:hypothetical protein
MTQDDRDFIIQSVNKLLNITVRCLTTAEISRLKNLLRTLR